MSPDRAVPVCISRTSPQHQLDHRDVFLLLNVDGDSSVAQIARRVSLPVDEVRDRFLELVALGFVRLETIPESGMYPKQRETLPATGTTR